MLPTTGGTIIIVGRGTADTHLHQAIREAMPSDVTLVFKTADDFYEPQQTLTVMPFPKPPKIVTIRIPPKLPEIPMTALKLTRADRATPNQPWYTKFQKRRRKK